MTSAASLPQMGKPFIGYVTQFWVNYNALKGKTFDVRAAQGLDRAANLLEQASHDAR